ncbi:MAG: helix-turn-helix domain-containing protein [Parafilimonas terrae]|nr:helix-turn-helix domain-containing protein [Parafilimonas terrae]
MKRTGRSEPPPVPDVITPEMLDWEALGLPEALRPACVPKPPAKLAPPVPTPPQRDNLMTEAEVAERLRCSVSKVRKLRYTGRLAFIPGRPVLITDGAFRELLEVEEQRRPRTRPMSKKANAAAGEKKKGTGGLSPEERGRILWLRHRAPQLRKSR